MSGPTTSRLETRGHGGGEAIPPPTPHDSLGHLRRRRALPRHSPPVPPPPAPHLSSTHSSPSDLLSHPSTSLFGGGIRPGGARVGACAFVGLRAFVMVKYKSTGKKSSEGQSSHGMLVFLAIMHLVKFLPSRSIDVHHLSVRMILCSSLLDYLY